MPRTPERIDTSRSAVLSFRLDRHQLRPGGGGPAVTGDVALLDYGVQDTGNDGAAWALRIRGGTVPQPADVILAWTIRGAPHVYRRRDAAGVQVATAPLSEADAASRIYDAARPLKAAGVPVLDALADVAAKMRAIVTEPTVKGEVSRRLTDIVGEPYLRACRPCGATHLHEMPFRLAALQAGLELQPDTAPPVLRRIDHVQPSGYQRRGHEAEARLDVIRNYLRFYGPARIADAAKFLDAPVRDVTQHWPGDVAEVVVTDEGATPRSRPRYVLAQDADQLRAAGAAPAAAGVTLLAPFDPYLQLRDRELLVPDAGNRKDLWRTLGRPGAVLCAGEVRGTWRASSRNGKLTVTVTQWEPLATPAQRHLAAEVERLAQHRGVEVGAVVWD